MNKHIRRWSYISEDARRFLDHLGLAGRADTYVTIARAAGIDPERLSLAMPVHDEVLVDVRDATPAELVRLFEAMIDHFGPAGVTLNTKLGDRWGVLR